MGSRAVAYMCSQCGRVAPNVTPTCAPYLRAVYLDSFRVVGDTLEVDGIELDDRPSNERRARP